jgi:choline dehydrogenase-like flavoprotein
MGDDAAAVVDPELRVRGVDRLRAAGLIREGVERT